MTMNFGTTRFKYFWGRMFTMKRHHVVMYSIRMMPRSCPSESRRLNVQGPMKVLQKLGMLFAALLAWSGASSGQTWTAVTLPFPGGAGTALLETDGNVMVQDTTGFGLGAWFELVPNLSASYASGVWIPLPAPPAWIRSAVLRFGGTARRQDRVRGRRVQR